MCATLYIDLQHAMPADCYKFIALCSNLWPVFPRVTFEYGEYATLKGLQTNECNYKAIISSRERVMDHEYDYLSFAPVLNNLSRESLKN